MKAVVYCKPAGKGVHAYFVRVNGKTYYLFESRYRVSNRDIFRSGISLDKINDYSTTRSTSVRKTKEKLSAYLSFIEKEYGVVIYSNRARRKEMRNRCRYNRSKVMDKKNFRYDDEDADIPAEEDPEEGEGSA